MNIRYFVLFLCVTVLMGCGTKSESTDLPLCHCKENKVSKDVSVKNGIAFRGNVPLCIIPEKLPYPDLYFSKNSMTFLKGNIVPYAVISFVENGCLLKTYDGEKQAPYSRLLETEKVFKYKVCNDELFLAKNDKDWDPVKILKVTEVEKDVKNEENAYYTCMKVELKSKWLNGEYEILCAWGE